MEDRMDDVKGRVKQAAGDLTDDEDLKREGRVDQAGAKVKGKLKDAQQEGADLVDEAKKKLHRDS